MFSIWDKQCGCYLYTGRNCTTKQEAIDAGMEYLTVDWSRADIRDANKDKLGTLSMVGLEVEEHAEPISED